MSPEFSSVSQTHGLVEFSPPPPEERTLEAFWNQWGEVSGFDLEYFSYMCETSAKRLGNTFDYHNEQHPLELLWVAMRWVDFFDSQGLNANRKVLIGAVLYHDDSYHEDHIGLGYESKEEFSAARFREEATLYGYTEKETELGSEIIMTTRRKEIPTTIEGVIMVLSDVWNMAGDYNKDFNPKTNDFAEETRKKQELIGKEFDRSAFMANSIAILSDYVWSLVSQKVCNVDKFVKVAVPNLRNLLREAADLDGLSTGQYFKKLNNPIVNKLLGNKLPESGN